MFGSKEKLLAPPELPSASAPVERREYSSTVVLQLWAVRAETEEAFHTFFAEDPAYWELEEEEKDDAPLSPFIATQGQTWFDHDFIEFAYSETPITSEAGLPPISWSNWFGADFVSRIAERGLVGVNGVLQLAASIAQDRRVDLIVPDPRDAKGPGIDAFYLGTVSFEHRFTL